MHLTKRAIDGLQSREKRYIVWDDKTQARFGVRVEPSGRRTFIVDYNTADGRRRRMVLGAFGIFTVEEARDKAEEETARARRGDDPLGEAQEVKAAPTMAEFVEVYMKEHALNPLKKKPRSAAEDERQFKKYVLPDLKARKVADITRADVAQLHTKMSKTPVQANRVVALLSKLMNFAEERGERPDGTNPCHHVKRYKETKATRYLSGEELTRLGAALRKLDAEYPAYVRAVRLLLMTGCRLNEVLSLAWADVDLENAWIHLADSKTGARDQALSDPAIALLASAEQGDSPWVIPSPRLEGRHLVNLQQWWTDKLRLAAELDGEVKIHSIRHTVGSVGAGAGLSILMVSRLLGQKQTSTAERYVHFDQDPLHAAATLISEQIQTYLDAKSPAGVVESGAGSR
jgi:integrase